MQSQVSQDSATSSSSAISSEQVISIIAGIKPGKKTFTNFVKHVKQDNESLRSLTKEFWKKAGAKAQTTVFTIPQGAELTLASSDKSKKDKTFDEFLVRHANEIVLSEGKLRLLRPVQIDSAVLKKLERYVDLEIEMIDLAAKHGSKKATNQISGNKLTNEGVDFIDTIFGANYTEDTLDAIRNYARVADVREESIEEFVSLFIKLIEAVNISLHPSYDTEQANALLGNVMENRVMSKLFHWYRKLYVVEDHGLAVTDETVKSLVNAFGKAKAKYAQDKANIANGFSKRLKNGSVETFQGVGADNVDNVINLLSGLANPVLNDEEKRAIAAGKTKAAQDKIKKQYVNRAQQEYLVALRQYPAYASQPEASLKRLGKNISKRIDDQYYAPTSAILIMSHALLDAANTPEIIKKSTDGDNVALKDALNGSVLAFTDRAYADQVFVREYAQSLVKAGYYAAAAKYVNAYISAVSKMVSNFVKDHNAQPKKKSTKNPFTSRR